MLNAELDRINRHMRRRYFMLGFVTGLISMAICFLIITQ